MMSKIKLLTIAAGGLLLINLGMLAFLLFNPHRPPMQRGPGREGPADQIIARLHFDAKQVVQYDELINEHRSAVRKLDGQIRSAKTALYATLAQDITSVTDSLKATLGTLQQAMETVHYDHFEKIKKICKPDQLGYFNDLTHDLASYFSPLKNRPTGGEGPPN